LRDVNVELSGGTSCHRRHLAFLRKSSVADANGYDLKSRSRDARSKDEAQEMSRIEIRVSDRARIGA
jgi:hypothetical protein